MGFFLSMNAMEQDNRDEDDCSKVVLRMPHFQTQTCELPNHDSANITAADLTGDVGGCVACSSVEAEASREPGSNLSFSQLHKLIHDIHDYSILDSRKNVMLIYVFLLLVYIGLNMGLIGANFQQQAIIEQVYYLPFHMLSFWGVFGFTTVEAFILIFTGTLSQRSQFYAAQAFLVLFNVVFTLGVAVIFSMSPDLYEITCHWMEYTIQIAISLVNFVFIINYLNGNKNSSGVLYRLRYLELTAALLVVLLSIFQLLIYGGIIDTGIEPERAAHMCEFFNEIFNGAFALLFAVMSYSEMQQKVVDHYTEMHKRL